MKTNTKVGFYGRFFMFLIIGMLTATTLMTFDLITFYFFKYLIFIIKGANS
ncbi:hypothetical protein PTRA_a2014 [Pseudoalteromonas translucida KMM 520]|uniref:Uncharacterized protein n=1 Tax=Pseudoalteromonas translucida KMM 520 TaxID=1315283 RepID=A0A0U2WIP9_9GAMM|nr:hypothetical protein PTRA_a2014 [Pseudoalteromonas translucida KMM 520]